jgi:SAM-dependent methyltransferase
LILCNQYGITIEPMPSLFRPRSRNWNKIFSNQGRVFHEPLPEVIHFAEWLKVMELYRVLDLGCGTGRHTVYMKQQGFDAWGLDNAPVGLKLTQDWLGQEELSAPLVLADVYQPFPFPDGFFDAIISTRVIHHSFHDRVLGAVGEMQRVLKKGGAVLLAVPGADKRRDKTKEVAPHTYVPVEGREKGIPHYIFSPDELKSLFANFSLCEVAVLEDRLNVLRAVK